MEKWKLAAILFLVVTFLVAAGSNVYAQTATPAPVTAKVEGQATTIDLAAKKITITPAQGPVVTLNVTASTEIEVWGKEPAAFQDVKAGNRVEAKYNPATLEAIQIEVKTEAPKGSRLGVFGTVKSIAASSITVDTKQGAVTLTINASTEFWDPPKKDATLSDVNVNDRVAVLAERSDSALLAKRILVIPDKPTHEQIKGVVTRISGTEITITYDSDKTLTGDAPPGIARKVELGDLVTAVVIRTPGVDKVSIRDIESSDKLLERLQRIASQKAGKDKQDIEQLMDKNRQKQEETLQRVLDKAPQEAKRGIQRALENAKIKGKTPVPGMPPQPPGMVPGKAP